MNAAIVHLAGALAAGIALGIQWPAPTTWGGPLCWLGALVCLILAVRSRSASATPLLLLTAVAGFGLGGQAFRQHSGSCAGLLRDGLWLDVRGELLSKAGERLRLRIREARVLDGGGSTLVARSDCSLVVPARLESPGVRPGQTVHGRGRWWTPPGARATALAIPGALMLDSALAEPGSDRGGALLTRIRVAAQQRVEALYGARSPLAASLLLARREGLDREVRERYARAGLSHLLAISGLHVGLVTGMLLLLAGAARVPRARAAAAAVVGTWAYVLFLGAPHSAVRAAIQLSLLLAATSLQRPTRPAALMGAAALGLLAVEPGALLAPGFQLSFAGVAGILAWRRPLLTVLGRLARWRPLGIRAGHWLADGLATSIAATVATAPIVAWHFGRVAPVGVVANLVAIPLLSALVPALALSLAAGAVWPAAGAFVAGGAGVLMDVLDRTAAWAAAVPGGTMALPGPAALTATGAIFAGAVLTRRLGGVRPGIRWLVRAGAAVAFIMAVGARIPTDHLEIHMIDVGQGDAIALRTPAGRWLLVDAGGGSGGGGRPGYDAGTSTVVPYLRAQRVGRLTGLLLTHPDGDHIGGAPAVVRALRPRWIADPGAVVGKGQYLELLRVAHEEGAGWAAPLAGAELELDGVTVEFLHPFEAVGAVEDANEASLVARVAYGEFAVLLTGDASVAVEEAILRRRRGALDADLLKVGHHGSATSTGESLLNTIGAGVALISAGRGNRYGHPNREVMARLERRKLDIYRTDRDGSIVVKGWPDGRMVIRTETRGKR